MDLQLRRKYNSEFEKLVDEINELHKTEKQIAIEQATEKYTQLIELNKALKLDEEKAIQIGNEEEKKLAKERLQQLINDEKHLIAQKNAASLAAEKKYEDDRINAKQRAEKQIALALGTSKDKEIAGIREFYAELIALAEKHSIDTTRILAAQAAAIKAIEDKSSEGSVKTISDKYNEISGIIRTYGDAASSLITPLFSILSNQAEKSIAETQAAVEARIKSLDKEREKGLMSDEIYNKKRAAIEKKGQKEINREKRKQAIQDRISASFQVALSTAEAIMKFLAMGPPQGPILAAAAGVAGGLQEAAIWTAKMPEYSKGNKVKGGVPEGPSHSNDGIALVNSQTGKKVGEMEGGEPYMILSKETYKNNGALIDRLLQVSMNEGGRRMTPGEIFGTPVRMNVPRDYSSFGKYRDGGITGPGSGEQINLTTVNPGSSPADSEILERLIGTVDSLTMAVNDLTGKPIKAFVLQRELEESDAEIKRVRSYANIGR